MAAATSGYNFEVIEVPWPHVFWLQDHMSYRTVQSVREVSHSDHWRALRQEKEQYASMRME